jgi:uncharacterized Zn finger protein
MTEGKKTKARAQEARNDRELEPTTGGARRWWAERWGSVMESIGVARRIERGRRYARAERVMSLEVAPSVVKAEVQGSRFEPYRVELGAQAFSDEQWDQAVKALASQALFSAKLLSGEMPENIDEAFSAVGLSLFPASSGELTMSCSCPDKVAPCKHIVAVHYQLAEKLDEDPFLLFAWRGRTKERILRELRRRRAAEASGGSLAPSSSRSLGESLPEFWDLGADAEEIPIAVGPPAVAVSVLKRLGPPPFWKSHPEIRGSLERLYAKVTERAMALAYGGRGIGEADET